MRCARCKRELDGLAGRWFEVYGFEQSRPEGGTNHIVARKRTGRVICGECMSEVKQGIPQAQGKIV